jgi:myo-inositol-1(or 4)-monophosphatase
VSLKTGVDPAFLTCAHRLADRAAKVTLPYFRNSLEVENKADATAAFDPVTAADREAERVIEEELARTFPEHGLEGEEFGLRRPNARYRWLVDPIDGTRAFMTGSPLWGTLIGLLDSGSPLIGLMDQPFTGERFWSDGKQSFARRDGSVARPIASRRCRKLADAAFMTTDPGLFKSERERAVLQRLQGTARLTRFGGDCYAYALLAMGFVDVIAECRLQPYDIVPLIPIIEHAGGRVTTWEGAPALHGGAILACGDKDLHVQILELIATAPTPIGPSG